MRTDKLIRFDWAIKYLLRDKANFDILEGFLSAVLERKVSVLELLESEMNMADADDKFNRVDLLVKLDGQELVLIEVQVESELDFFHRIVFGTSKLITENMRSGKAYGTIKKAISISIAYFSLGRGEDYLYYGSTNFIGVNTGDTLAPSSNQQNAFGLTEVKKIFPEHYIIRVEKFSDEIKKAVDEWIYMLKNSEVKPEFESEHIQAASEKLKYMSLDKTLQQAYRDYMENETYHSSMLWSSHEEGRQEGLHEGLQKGLEKGKIEIIRKAFEGGVPIETVVLLTGMNIDAIKDVQEKLMQE